MRVTIENFSFISSVNSSLHLRYSNALPQLRVKENFLCFSILNLNAQHYPFFSFFNFKMKSVKRNFWCACSLLWASNYITNGYNFNLSSHFISFFSFFHLIFPLNCKLTKVNHRLRDLQGKKMILNDEWYCNFRIIKKNCHTTKKISPTEWMCEI